MDEPAAGPAPLPARLGWMLRWWPAWAGAMGVVFVVGQLAQRPSLFEACASDDDCLRYQLDDDALAALADFGISRSAYAWTVIGSAVLSAATLLALGYLVRARAERQLLPVAFAWALPAMGATFYLRESAITEVGLLGPLVALGFVVNFSTLPTLLATFPSGRCVPRWTRWIVVVLVPVQVADLVDMVQRANDDEGWMPEPLYDLAGLAFVVGPLVLLGAQVYRYRRSVDPVERRQTRWILGGFAAAVATPVGFIGAAYLTGASLTSPSEYGGVSFLVLDLVAGIAALVFFAALATSVVRFGLWGVELVLNRLLVWGTLTVGVLALYGGTVALVSGVLDVDNSGLPAVAVAVAVGLGLGPARRRLQRLADRLVWGRRDDPTAVASEMRDVDADLTDPDEVLAELAAMLAHNLKLPATRITVDLPDGTIAAGEHGDVPVGAESIPLRVGGAVIGELVCPPRSGQQRLSSQDRKAIETIGHQVAVTAGMLRLAHEREGLRQRLVAARDEERKRLRHDLHDGLGPTLASIGQRIQAARSADLPDERSDALLADAGEGLHDAIAELRRIVHALRPPSLDQYGLVGALQRSVERAGNTQIHVVGDIVDRPISPDREIALFRVAEEAILNAHRHASASHVDVHLSGDRDGFCLEVLDDGVGIASEPAYGVGIRSMQERVATVGGTLDIGRLPEGGTVVRARVPWGAAP